MRDLRPLLAVGEAPLVLRPEPCPLLDGSVRPLCRGLVLASVLALPALGALAAERVSAGGPQPEPVRLALVAAVAR